MKIKYILTLITVLLAMTQVNAINYTWLGNSTSFADSNNWSPAGIPIDSIDNITISSGTYNLVLDQNRKITNLTLSSKTIDLNGYSLTVYGTATMTSGTVTDGDFIARGNLAAFNGTLMDCVVDADCGYIRLSGSTFNEIADFSDQGVATGNGTGGCTFNDDVTITHNGTLTYFNLGGTSGDTFNQNVTFTNNSNRELNIATNGNTTFNGNIILNSTSNGGILIGNSSGTATLASGKTISIGGSGFAADYLTLRNFTQSGSTAQTLALTSTAIVNIMSCTFNGDLTVSSPGFLLKNSTFNGTSSFTRTATSGNYQSDGGNTFNGSVTVDNSGTSGRVRWATVSADVFNGNATFNSSGGQDVQIAYSGDNLFAGDITINSNKVVFNTASGKVTFTGGNSQTLNRSYNFPFKKLAINKSANHVTANTTLSVDDTLFLVSKNLITTATYLLTMKHGSTASGASNSSFVSGPVKKVGNTAYIFSIGSGTTYRPVEITAPSSASDAFTAEYFDTTQVLGSTMDTTLNYISNCGYWSLVRTTGSSNITPKFAFDSTHCDYLMIKPVHISFWNGTKWLDKGLGDSDGNYRKTSSAQSSFGYFALGYYLQNGDDYTMPISVTSDSICEASELIVTNKKSWFSFSPDSSINTILLNKSLMGSNNMAFINTFSIYSSSSPAEKELVYKWHYGESDSLQSDITLYANLDTSKVHYIAIEKLMEADCSFCEDDSTYISMCISNRNQSASVLNQLSPQNPSWSQPPYRFDFNNGSPSINGSSLTVTPQYTHNVQQDLNGNVLFYVVDGTIYDANGSFVYDIECDCYNGELLHGTSEFLIVPVPGNCNQYYLIGGGRTSSQGGGDPKPYYVIYDFSTGEVLGTDGLDLNPAVPLPSYSNDVLHHGILHFAATPSTNNFRYLFVSSTEFIYRYKITHTGIELDNSPSDGGIIDLQVDLGFDPNGSASMRSEMEVYSFPNNTFFTASSAQSYQIAVPLEGRLSGLGNVRNFLMIGTLDAQGVINSSSVKFIDMVNAGLGPYRDIKGLEFSPNGQYLYVNTTFAPYMFYVDVNASTPALIPLLSGSIINASDFQDSQIEWAHDGKLYMGSGNRMACINDPNNPTTTTFSDPAPGISNLSTPITTTVGNGIASLELVVLPDQIDGEVYGYSMSMSPILTIGSVDVACSGSNITLSTPAGFTSYLWNTTATTQNISVNNSGVYSVVVTDADGCQAKAYKEVSMLDCCTGTQFTYTGNFYASQLPNPLTSGFNGVPAGSGPTIALNGKLLIDVHNFVLSDLELVMGENSVIRFFYDLTLTFENNNYIHGCDENMWEGIILTSVDQKIEATDGNTWIEDAKIAIDARQGGEFQLENVHFNRNWKSLVVNLNTNIAHPGRVFNNCKFTSEELYPGAPANCFSPYLGLIPEVGIEINGMGIFEVGNSAFADNVFRNLRKGISAVNVKRGRIEGCNFEDITDAGIYSYNSKLFILGNDFINSQSGIKSTNSSTSLFYGHTIAGNTFTDVNYHIIDWGGKYHNIGPGYGFGKNFFGDDGSDPVDNIAGTFFLGTSAFNMVDNEFYRNQYGSIVFNSGPYGGRIDYLDEGNFYQDCNKAILGAGDNSKLTIHCNNFNTTLGSYYDLNSWDFSATASVLADQGTLINNVKAPAGDRFIDQVYRDIVGNSSSPFDYIGHDFDLGNCSEDKVRITPGIGVDYYWLTNNCFDATDPDVPCKPEPCPPPCNDRIIAVTNEIDSLVTEYITLDEFIQTEETEDLLYEINNNGDEENLSEILLTASPLSDSVLVALSRAHSALTSSTLKSIFEVNSILSDYVKNEIINENTSLDSTDKADLMLLQGNYTLRSTLAGFVKQINQKKVSRQLYINDMIRYYADSDSVDAAVDALLLIGSETDIQTVFSTCMNFSLFETAQEVYGTLVEIETIDPDWLLVQGLLLELALNNKTVFDIDSAQHSMLYTIADKSGASLATANSRSILKLVFNEEFEDEFGEESRLAALPALSSHPENKISANFISLSPNPTKNQVTVTYNLPGNSENATFELYDIFGSLILKKEVASGKNQFRLQVTDLSPGIYMCVVRNNTSLLQKKLVITK